MSRRRARLVACDDEPAARRAVRRALGSRHDVVEAADGRELLELLSGSSVDLVLLDLQMPVMDGLTALRRLLETEAPPPVIVLTADPSPRTAVEAVRAGATDYLSKPFEIEELRLAVDQALATERLRRDHARLSADLRRLRGGGELAGSSEAMERVRALLDKVAPTDVTVLITGETGTGKELAARRIHEGSAVADGPFVAVNCAAIPEGLVESELFGHRKGAFTGADRDRRGRFREADGGTLFLDEIGDMPAAVQGKLLRVLQDSRVEPVGGGPAREVSVRIVAATHRDLQALVEEGRFREDLLYRLRVVDVALPPLRERGDDVVELATRFLARSSDGTLELSAGAAAALRKHAWPGNVRELANAMERAAIFATGGRVEAADLPGAVVLDRAGPTPAEPAVAWEDGDDFQAAKRRVVERFERAVLEQALGRSGGNVSAAARALGLHRQNLQQKLRALGLDPAAYRGGGDEP